GGGQADEGVPRGARGALRGGARRAPIQRDRVTRMASRVTTGAASSLSALIAERERIVRGFFEREAERLARACHAMARQSSRGGTLIPFGTGAAATDASHAAVEFMHPVIVGKRALPAISPASDTTRASALSSLARPDDIGLAISHGELD